MSDQRPQWEDCKVCGGDHWTKDHPVAGDLQGLFDQGLKRHLATERSAVIAAARLFLAAHDRVVGSGKVIGVTRDDAYAMRKAADDLRDVLDLHDENRAPVTPNTTHECPICGHVHLPIEPATTPRASDSPGWTQAQIDEHARWCDSLGCIAIKREASDSPEKP